MVARLPIHGSRNFGFAAAALAVLSVAPACGGGGASGPGLGAGGAGVGGAAAGSGGGAGAGAAAAAGSVGCTVPSGRSAPPRAKIGATCSDSCRFDGPSAWVCDSSNTGVPQCYFDDGLYCDFVAHSCVHRKTLGETCEAGVDYECVAGTVCSASGLCAMRRSMGSPCDSPSGCTDGLYCNMATQTCVSQKTPGSPCDSGAQCQGHAGNDCNDHGCGSCFGNKCVADTPMALYCSGVPSN